MQTIHSLRMETPSSEIKCSNIFQVLIQYVTNPSIHYR